METAPPISPDELRGLEDEERRIADKYRAMAESTWQEVDLVAEVADGLEPDKPAILRRTDGRALLYRSKTHAFVGEPESGKTWAALAAAREVIADGGHVFYVDFEDSAKGIIRRLVLMGLPLDDALARLHYFRPTKPLEKTPGSVAALVAAGGQYRPVLVILDGVTEAMACHGLDPNSMEDVARFYDLMPRRWDQTGAAVVMIDHVVKSKDDRGRYAIGSQHKLAGQNGASYTFKVEDTIAPGKHGEIKIEVAKDREGEVRAVSREGKVAAKMHMRPAPDRGPRHLDITLEPDNEIWVPSESLQEAVLKVLREAPATQTAIGDRSGRSLDDVGRALDWFQMRGAVEGGKRQKWRLIGPDPEETPRVHEGETRPDPEETPSDRDQTPTRPQEDRTLGF